MLYARVSGGVRPGTHRVQGGGGFSEAGVKVVIIEEDIEDDWIGMSEELGTQALIGDATDVQML